MRKVLLGSGLLAACLVSSANAEFLGFGSDSYAVTVGENNYDVLDVYAVYSSTSDKFLNVIGSNIQLIGASAFYQSNGTWQPTNTGSNAADSKVATGPAVGNTSADPSFVNYNDEEGEDPTLPPTPGAGWFTSNPSPANNSNGAKVITTQGIWQGTNGPFGVFIGRFSVAAGADQSRFLVFASEIGTGVVGGSGTFFSSDTKTFKYAVPTPGALALLGLAGIAGRRRRA